MDFERFKPLIGRMVAGWRNILAGNPRMRERLLAMHAALPRAEFERQVTQMLLSRRVPFPVSGLGVAELSQISPEMFTLEPTPTPAPTTNWGAIATGAATVLSSVLNFVAPHPTAAAVPAPAAITTITPRAPADSGVPTWAWIAGGGLVVGAIAIYATS